jgi:hypothetical protein
MMPGIWSTQTSEIAFVMSKPAPTSCREQGTTKDVDQAWSVMLDALRKPLKPTATLKRRALKIKPGGKSMPGLSKPEARTLRESE